MWHGPRTTLLAHFADAPVSAELSTEPAQSERDQLLLELERLADELRQLEPELAQLHGLLDTNGSSPELDEIATRMSRRVTQICQRRLELDVQVDAALRP
jgi:cell shape-determining protein MreC